MSCGCPSSTSSLTSMRSSQPSPIRRAGSRRAVGDLRGRETRPSVTLSICRAPGPGSGEEPDFRGARTGATQNHRKFEPSAPLSVPPTLARARRSRTPWSQLRGHDVVSRFAPYAPGVLASLRFACTWRANDVRRSEVASPSSWPTNRRPNPVRCDLKLCARRRAWGRGESWRPRRCGAAEREGLLRSSSRPGACRCSETCPKRAGFLREFPSPGPTCNRLPPRHPRSERCTMHASGRRLHCSNKPGRWGVRSPHRAANLRCAGSRAPIGPRSRQALAARISLRAPPRLCGLQLSPLSHAP